jgi:hypothetical protein
MCMNGLVGVGSIKHADLTHYDGASNNWDRLPVFNVFRVLGFMVLGT